MQLFSPTSLPAPPVEDSLEDPEGSIVIPCLNEAETLEAVIGKTNRAIALHYHLHAEISVADNGSTDGSQHIAMTLVAKAIPAEIRGYGVALQAGIEQVQGEYIIPNCQTEELIKT